jgi:ATP-binding cassette, subfamily C (CFTR/MRP), member 1
MIAALGVSALAGPRQELWLKAIEKRVDATAKILGSMKTVKMTGLEQKMSTILQNFRAIEITKSEKFRQLLIVVVGFGKHLAFLILLN